MAELVILESAQKELEETARIHLNLVGPNSAEKIADLIYDAVARLETFPLSGYIPQDKELRNIPGTFPSSLRTARQPSCTGW